MLIVKKDYDIGDVIGLKLVNGDEIVAKLAEITDEHYVMLEEMIRLGRTDIVLRYNTNASNIKYKKHDILDLWKHFKKIELSCSVDHYGERAEYLRKGTEWGRIESNLLTFRELDYVVFQINTVFSLFNYLTIGSFYDYLMNYQLSKTFKVISTQHKKDLQDIYMDSCIKYVFSHCSLLKEHGKMSSLNLFNNIKNYENKIDNSNILKRTLDKMHYDAKIRYDLL